MMNDLMQLFQQDYLLRALLAGIGLCLISGPLGVFVIWQRMAFFGDTLAHSGLLGVTLALAFEIDIMLGIGVVAVFIAVLLMYLKNKLVLSNDALLGILSPATLALGLICLSFFKSIQIDVLGLLIGDILAITWREIIVIYTSITAGLVAVCLIWTPLLRLTIDKDLAQVEGVKTQSVQMVFILLLAMIVAVAVKLVGVLLISAMLIIPAAMARIYAKTPEQMAFLACLFGIVATFLGLIMAIFCDLPVGPAVVVALLGCFIVITATNKLSNL